MDRPADSRGPRVAVLRRTGPGRGVLAPLFLCLILLAASCGLVTGGTLGGAGPPPVGSLAISFIDVGQGDSVLVQAGGANYLIDAGEPEQGPNVVDFLRSRGVRRLDGVVASSGDSDHSGGLADVFRAFPVETVYVSGAPKGTMTWGNFLRAVRDEGASLRMVRAGNKMDWAGVRVDHMSPKVPSPWSYDSAPC